LGDLLEGGHRFLVIASAKRLGGLQVDRQQGQFWSIEGWLGATSLSVRHWPRLASAAQR
jgi:hypothetical protein